MRALDRIEAALLDQRGHLFAWVPVFLALGVGGYFLLRVEPAPWVLGLCAGAGAVMLVFQRRLGAAWGPPLAAVALILLGVAVAGARAHQVSAPVLSFRYYGPVEGRIIGIDRSASDAVRLTLDRVVLSRTSPDRTPERVRVSLHGEQGFITPTPGMTVILTGHLSPPQGAVEPGGFDFRRHSWFLRLGAVGYTRTPVLMLEPPEGGLFVFRARMALSAKVQAALPGETGAFAAAVMTGDRSGMGQDTLEALRQSNLAHLLAISGLHMGLLAGFVFAALRLGFLLWPAAALRLPVKKLAAGGAMLVAGFYLALSGGNVATERAFVMAAVALGAVIVDRRALSLRAVAMAALIVLILRPEALLGPGFQMSFAATAALVAVFGALRDLDMEWVPRWVRPILAVVISSAVAGAATAPVGMAHFNQAAHYGLLANLVSVPLMGALVMPAAVVSACLLPFGLEGVALWFMGLGLDWILLVATTVSGWEGAVGQVTSPGPWVLPMLALGMLFLMLWQGRVRLAGLGPVALALALWAGADRPGVLVAEDGALMGVLGPEGRALSKPKGAGFVAGVWLENDGDAAEQAEAATRWPGGGVLRELSYGARTFRHAQGKRGLTALMETGCAAEEIVVTTADLEGRELPCDVYDPQRLRQTGAMSFDLEEGRLVRRTAAEYAGDRLWTGAPRKKLQLASAD
ncbi:ComEC/Rec2 family competence protein [Primorskyibacter sedentarius]|uniref:ComEC/Rec2 family competence protein n=1 Tax=Primorskyibacter sedentarius TaxID=745311 RepID=UPI003EBDAF3F